MSFAQLAGYTAMVIFLYMSLFFILARLRDDNSIVDIGWGAGFIVVALSCLFLQGDFTARQIIVTVLVFIWGARLATRIFKRNWGKGEDFRYKKWRQDWGKYFILRSYFQIFMLQGFFMWLISMPLMIIAAGGSSKLLITDYIGIVFWIVGFCFEAIGDYQLDKFLANPENRGKILDKGLWQYTRHPNYFGEIVMWWAIAIIALTQPWGWIGIIGAATITVLILFVSGIPLLERSMMNNPAYREYARRTSIFFPIPPGK